MKDYSLGDILFYLLALAILLAILVVALGEILDYIWTLKERWGSGKTSVTVGVLTALGVASFKAGWERGRVFYEDS